MISICLLLIISIAEPCGKAFAHVHSEENIASGNQSNAKTRALVDRLSALRHRIGNLEQNLLDGLQSQDSAKSQVKKIQRLLKLQNSERVLGAKRMQELENTVTELETRRASLSDKMVAQQIAIRKFLVAIELSNRGDVLDKTHSLHLPEQEKIEAPRRKVLANMVDHGLKEIEMLRADLADAAQLQAKIEDEKQQLTYLFQDLKEQESVLELNRQLQIDFLRKKYNERMGQLENYQKLKSAESQVEHLIGEFNARMELEHSEETERAVTKAMAQGVFYQQKGKLPFPVSAGKVVSSFGRTFDSRTGLYIFKKGVDISVGKKESVKAISAGRVAFAGALPDYGNVVIIDHGEHFYSLCAHLGAISKKTNESVAAGDAVGTTADSSTPLYFEIRSRNVAVNPLQWVLN